LVDVERGRTVKGWLPRRLGGGLGGTRRGGADVNVRHSGRDDTRGREREGGERRRRSRSRSRDSRRKRSRSRDRKPRRSRSRDRKRSRSRDKKRTKRSRSRSRERRREKRERREGAGPEGGDGFQIKEEPADSGYNDQYGNYDHQGINVKQEKVEGEEDAPEPEDMEPVDRNLPMAAPGEEGDYGY